MAAPIHLVLRVRRHERDRQHVLLSRESDDPNADEDITAARLLEIQSAMRSGAPRPIFSLTHERNGEPVEPQPAA